MRIDRIALSTAALAAAMLSAAAARADNSPLGLWIDHTGRGAVEITDCGGKLCGHVAWVKDAENASECGKQIIGNVRPVGKNKWDKGWIYDPDRGSKYDVELTALGADKLKVMGYAGMKWLSETYTWKRAPADMQKCSSGGSAEATPAPASAAPAETAQAEAAKDADKPAVAKDADKPAAATKADAVELEPAKPEPDKAATARAAPDTPAAKKVAPAKPDEVKPRDTAKAEPQPDDEAGDGERGGQKIVARIMKQLEDGDGPVKLQRKGKNCKVNVPYVDMVVSFRCDKDN